MLVPRDSRNNLPFQIKGLGGGVVVHQEIIIEEEEISEEETAPLTPDRQDALAGTRAFIIIKSSPFFPYVALY